MGKKIVLTPSIQRILQRMGEQIKLARLRRNISMEIVAERSGLGRTTVWAIEKGSPSVSGHRKRQPFCFHGSLRKSPSCN